MSTTNSVQAEVNRVHKEHMAFLFLKKRRNRKYGLFTGRCSLILFVWGVVTSFVVVVVVFVLYEYVWFPPLFLAKR